MMRPMKRRKFIFTSRATIRHALHNLSTARARNMMKYKKTENIKYFERFMYYDMMLNYVRNRRDNRLWIV